MLFSILIGLIDKFDLCAWLIIWSFISWIIMLMGTDLSSVVFEYYNTVSGSLTVSEYRYNVIYNNRRFKSFVLI